MILALDVSASNTGWCKGDAVGPVKTGSFALRHYRRDIGALLAAYQDWMMSTLDGVTLITFEQPVRPFANANLDTMRKLYALAGVAELVAHRAGIECCEVNTATAKKIVYGRGNFTTKDKKAHAVNLVAGWGIDAANHDEADAAAVFLTTLHLRMPEAFAVWERRKADILSRVGETLL